MILMMFSRMENFFAMSKEDAPDNIPMMFITVPSAKDPEAEMRHPGKRKAVLRPKVLTGIYFLCFNLL